MDAVVEIDEVGKVVNADPVQRLVVTKTRAHRFEERRVGEEDRMAVHAGFRRRNSGERGRLDRRVAVPAIDAVVIHMMHVAELQRLLDEDLLPRDIARPGDDDRQQDEPADKGKKAENADFGKCVSASTEYLRHLTLAGATAMGGPYSHGLRCGGDQSALYHSCEKRIKEGQCTLMSDDRKYRQRGYHDDERERSPKPAAKKAPEPGAPAGARRLSQDGPRTINMPAFRELVRCSQCGNPVSADVGFDTRCPRCGIDLHTCS